MRNDYSRLIESYATTKCGPLSDVVIEQPCFSGKTTVTIEGWSLDALIAAGWVGHWGTSLLRLKYGLAASEFRTCLAKFRELSDDDELTQFLAHDVLLGWLLDRRIRGRGEWAAKCQSLRRKINSEALEAAYLMAYKLGLRYDMGNKT
jgi:hypothetical protein